MQTFEEWWKNCPHRFALDLHDVEHEFIVALAWNTAAGPRDQEIERLRTRLSALEAAVDEVIRIADSGGSKLPHVIWAAIDRLRAARGTENNTTKGT